MKGKSNHQQQHQQQHPINKRRISQAVAPSLQVNRRNRNELVVTCYGAGSEVGRSCILVEISGKRILLDCGVNIATNNPDERLPKLPSGQIAVDLVLISHIHSDHLCSLPYLTERRECNAPVYMSKASLLLAPIMLEDFIKVTENPPFNKDQIFTSIRKVKGIEFNQRIECVPGIYVLALPAGHLLGATAFYVSCDGRSFLYTGDFSGAADHHLSGHRIPRLYPDLLITESTYGNKTREPMYRRERSFVQMVHRCVLQKGKVLIPVFAVGRLQEILMMLDDYWTRMQCDIPIYFSSGMGARATEVYKKCIMWMNSTVQTSFFDLDKQNLNFSHVKLYDKVNLDSIPCVMVATSGMLNNGPAFEFFIKKGWYKDSRNLVIFPGYCGEETLGRKILELPEDGHVVFEKYNIDIIVKCKVERVSFSAHADQFEIMTMAERLSPRSCLCIHGDEDSVKTLAESIHNDLGIDSRVAKNCEPKKFEDANMKRIQISRKCLDENSPNFFSGVLKNASNFGTDENSSNTSLPKVVPIYQAAREVGLIARRLHVKRRVQTNASFIEVCRLVKDMNLVDDGETFEEEKPIQTKYFLIEFKKNGLLISYELRFKSKANKFCCLVAQSKVE